MTAKRPKIPKRTVADRTRHKAIRQEFAHCPTREELEASGAYEGPISAGAYFLVRVLVEDLRKSRQAAGLTLAAVSKRTGIHKATLSRLENARVPNPSVDTLWRYATGVGRQLVLTHADMRAGERRDGNAVRSAPR